MQAAVSSTPVLRFYNLAEKVTQQCDASQHGLGAALLQNGQPVTYALRALTSAETRYAQIEKELLAIVFACERFEAYIYGRDETNGQMDHKPLESIFKKPLNSTPKRLQRMMLQLQKYQLTVKYHRGETLTLADTLSRVFLPEVNTTNFTEELASIDHRATLPVSEARWMQVNKESADDAVGVPSFACLCRFLCSCFLRRSPWPAFADPSLFGALQLRSTTPELIPSK